MRVRFPSGTPCNSCLRGGGDATLSGMPTITVNGEQVATLSILPPGSFLWYCSNTVPSGFLKCDGSLISRTQYAALFAVIGTTFGTTTSSNFKLPDLSTAGRFVRAGSVGTVQGDAIRNITGSISGIGTVPNLYWALLINSMGGVFYGLGSEATQGGTVSDPASRTGSTSILLDVSRQVPTASENRPVNIALLPIVKY